MYVMVYTYIVAQLLKNNPVLSLMWDPHHLPDNEQTTVLRHTSVACILNSKTQQIHNINDMTIFWQHLSSLHMLLLQPLPGMHCQFWHGIRCVERPGGAASSCARSQLACTAAEAWQQQQKKRGSSSSSQVSCQGPSGNILWCMNQCQLADGPH